MGVVVASARLKRFLLLIGIKLLLGRCSADVWLHDYNSALVNMIFITLSLTKFIKHMQMSQKMFVSGIRLRLPGILDVAADTFRWSSSSCCSVPAHMMYSHRHTTRY